MHPKTHRFGRFRRSLMFAMALVWGAPGQARAAEAYDPGGSWAPPAADEAAERGPEAAERPEAAPGGREIVAEDDSLGQRSGPGVAPRADKPAVAVVILDNRLGKPFEMSVIQRIMEPLVPHSTLTRLPLVRKAVARMGLPPRLLHLPKNLQRLGASVGADFTLVVEAVGHGRQGGVFAGLVNVHTGETVVAKRVPMATRAVTNSQAIVLVDLLVNALSGPEAAAPEAPEARPSDRSTAPGAPALDMGGPLAEAPGHDRARRDEDSDKEHDKDGKDAKEAPEPEDPNALYGPRVARLTVGLALSQRVGHLVDTQKSAYTPPQYAGSGNNTNPFFPGFQLDGEVFSGLATRHRRAWFDQFGVGLNLTLAPVLSYTTTGGNELKLKSTVMNLSVMAQYRLLFLPHRKITPSLTLQVGLSHFAFPLANAQFPGVAYTAPHIGIDFFVPFHRALGIRINAGVRPGAKPGGNSGTLLGKKTSGLGFLIGGGLQANWRLLEIGLKVNYERWAFGYTGTTSLANTPTPTGATSPVQFTNIKLKDQLLGLMITAGVGY